jgi:hypothetical protein
MNTLKVGDRVRLRGNSSVGTIKEIDRGYAMIEYEYRQGTTTSGYYPVSHLEKVEETAAPVSALPVSGPPSPRPSAEARPATPGEGGKERAAFPLDNSYHEPVKPKARTADVLGTQPKH